jgi:hypothetical protein
MKKSFVLMVALLVTIASFAQHRVYGSGYYRAPVIVHSYYPSYGFGLGYGMGYGFGYPYSYYPSYGVAARPSKLDQAVADITHEYAQKIESARMDKTLSGKERRHEVKALKIERDQRIDDAKRNFYKQK